MNIARESIAFSMRAACGVLDSYGAGDNMIISILTGLRDAGKIESGYVRQKDLNAAIVAAGLKIAA